ncbi:MAG: PadR family transcriptional regulator [Treponema sp.]|nr:PadR family transcriptional regulator [Treponema sp.]
MEKYLPLTESVFYILLALRKPNHGYGIIQEVKDLTKGRINMGAGTLYGAIQTLEGKGWIQVFSEETDSRKKKEYVITEEGKAVFISETNRLSELLDHSKLMNK